MKRDMDLVRELLLLIEKEIDPAEDTESPPAALEGRTHDEIVYHLTIMAEAGFLIGEPALSNAFFTDRMTWAGHDFLDGVRDEAAWKKTKDGAQQIGSWTVGVLVDLAKAYAKQEAKKRLGLDL